MSSFLFRQNREKLPALPIWRASSLEGMTQINARSWQDWERQKRVEAEPRAAPPPRVSSWAWTQPPSGAASGAMAWNGKEERGPRGEDALKIYSLDILGPGWRVVLGHEHTVGEDGAHDEHAEERVWGQGKPSSAGRPRHHRWRGPAPGSHHCQDSATTAINRVSKETHWGCDQSMPTPLHPGWSLSLPRHRQLAPGLLHDT